MLIYQGDGVIFDNFILFYFVISNVGSKENEIVFGFKNLLIVLCEKVIFFIKGVLFGSLLVVGYVDDYGGYCLLVFICLGNICKVNEEKICDVEKKVNK